MSAGGDGIGVDVESGSGTSGKGDTSRNALTEAVLTCEVIEVLPGGRLHIWGYKTITANRETQYLVVDALVREEDIGLDNVVMSARLARATIEITGSGVVADKQVTGAGQRFFDHIWPF